MEECAFQKSSATAHDSAKPKQGTLWITTKSPTDVRSTWWFMGGVGVVISRFLGRITTVITSVRGHITPLITTHELLNLVLLAEGWAWQGSCTERAQSRNSMSLNAAEPQKL